jgi:hypothetical protein
MSRRAAKPHERPQVERLQRAVATNAVVVSSEPLELLRARKRGRLAIDARQVAAAMMAELPEFFAPGAEDV